jgi:S1-C subfamily serine protease
MVLTSDGEILTNNHVIQGATRVTVTVVSTGRTYPASVVGTDPSDDVAVLQLDDASGLRVADFSDEEASIGEAVTAVGNAGGSGGTPSAVSGTVTALDQSITATGETGGNPEELTGLIETDADVQAGDSGGPLYDTASGEIIGMDTAASTGGQVDGYAIPIASARSLAGQITSGVDSAPIHQGLPAFLGVSVS